MKKLVYQKPYFLLLSAALLLGMVGLSSFLMKHAPAKSSPQQTTVKKNVILIMVDDLNDTPNGFKGTPVAVTPNIDRLRAWGVSFRNANCASPVCNPSRTALLSGLAPWVTTISTNSEGQYFRDVLNRRFANISTLPQHFKNNGYYAFSAGKIFHTPTGTLADAPSWTENRTSNIGSNNGPLVAGSGKSVANSKVSYGAVDKAKEDFNDWNQAKTIADYLRSAAARTTPFFAACGIFRPHLPHYYPKEYQTMYTNVSRTQAQANSFLADINDCKGGNNGELRNMLNDGGPATWQEATRAYMRSVSFADACIGQILDAYNALPADVKARTIIVLAGDHGFHLGEKGHWMKAALWQKTTQTTFIMYDPALTGGHGKSCNVPVSLQDIFPTVTGLCGLTRPDNDPNASVRIWGRDIRPLLENPTRTDYKGYAITYYGNGGYSLKTQDWRYIRYSSASEELYYHGTGGSGLPATDEDEQTNLLAGASVPATYRSKANEMKGIADRIIAGNIDNPFPAGARLTTEKLTEQLGASEVEVYPNPVQQVLRVKNATASSVLKVYDMSGRLLLESKGSPAVNTSGLSKGTYILLVDQKKAIRFVKE